ncbi:TPA: hypothetical protein SAZ36_000765 [Yersinia enterocolitica]|nr:hypothetical protein [Yersinia enterocolitica]
MALTLLSANNASTVLAAGISASATTLTVNTGTGGLFPSPVSGTSFFKLTLIDSAKGTLTEIVHVTARSGDAMTIVRGQEGTANRLWSANDIAANMMTAGTLDLFAQSGGLGGAALLNVGTTAGTVAAGNDNRITGALQKANNLSEIAAAGSVAQAAAQANIGLTASKFSGRLLNTQTFTSTGTYTPTAGTGYIIVEAVGGGGASGAISATSASQNAITSVGSPGAYAKVLYTSVPSTASVVIGSGGVGILGAGPTGGGTTFGSILTCPGGPGSVVGNPHVPPGGSTGQGGPLSPTVSGGGQIITSAFGQQNNPTVTVSFGVGTNYASTERTQLGNYGTGGAGQFNNISQTQKVGGNGANGYLIIWEYSA